jgi:hypothetical protein
MGVTCAFRREAWSACAGVLTEAWGFSSRRIGIDYPNPIPASRMGKPWGAGGRAVRAGRRGHVRVWARVYGHVARLRSYATRHSHGRTRAKAQPTARVLGPRGCLVPGCPYASAPVPLLVCVRRRRRRPGRRQAL